jgi:Dipeptidyl aminopeptidases/acylaminoacyl-peptidases
MQNSSHDTFNIITPNIITPNKISANTTPSATPRSKTASSISKTQRAFGCWPSAIDGDQVAGKSPRLSEPSINQGRLFWLQTLPEEKGRVTIMMQPIAAILSPDSSAAPTSLLPKPLSTRSKVHEYGGGSYLVDGDDLYFVLADDQHIYHVDIAATVFEPKPLTDTRADFSPAGETLELRFADLLLDKHHNRILAVCEAHQSPIGGVHTEPRTRLVSIGLDNPCSITTVAEGSDFYASPCISGDGQWLTWLCWNHPNMPWDQTTLNGAKVASNGDISTPQPIAGNGQESLFLPRFSGNGDLLFVSDRTNWWNLYRLSQNQLERCLQQSTNSEQPTALTEELAEFATPQWTFRMSTYGQLNQDTLIAACSREGSWQLGLVPLKNNQPSHQGSPQQPSFKAIDTAAEGHPLSVISDLATQPCRSAEADEDSTISDAAVCAFIGASPTSLPNLYLFAPSNNGSQIHKVTDIDAQLSSDNISMPQPISFPTGAQQEHAHGFYYPPTNADYSASESSSVASGETRSEEASTDKTSPSKQNEPAAPPMIFICHGGPTGATEASLNLKIQYWTNRGFAVMDVNYRGSTGFGRQYRHSLHGNWGMKDVEDMSAAADFAIAQGWANPKQLIIKGSSAGGYTTLAALAFSERFNAGVSLYGIGDLETLARDTHKFEARYLDSLVGPYPAAKSIYQQRSPIHFVEQINCPILVFQGLEDRVVPPNQAEAMVQAVKAKGIPVSYITFADEGHGFRNAKNIATMLTHEYRFYCELFQLGIQKAGLK